MELVPYKTATHPYEIGTRAVNARQMEEYKLHTQVHAEHPWKSRRGVCVWRGEECKMTLTTASKPRLGQLMEDQIQDHIS